MAIELQHEANMDGSKLEAEVVTAGEKTYHDVLLGLLKRLLVSDTFKLVALLDKASVLGLNLALLLHDLGDLFAHHLGHLLAHVVLQHL